MHSHESKHGCDREEKLFGWSRQVWRTLQGTHQHQGCRNPSGSSWTWEAQIPGWMGGFPKCRQLICVRRVSFRRPRKISLVQKRFCQNWKVQFTSYRKSHVAILKLMYFYKSNILTYIVTYFLLLCVHVQNIRITGVTNSHIQDKTSLNSKLFHINVINSKHLTLQRITIDAPQESLNTDGIHIGRSSYINVTDANIKTGDDCVSLGDGSQNINVEKVTCGSGHGISIGSLGRYVLTEIENNYVTFRVC